MAQLEEHFDATHVEPRGSYDPLPAGRYVAAVKETEIAPVSRNDAGKGRALVLCWEVIEGNYAGRLIWQRLNLYFNGQNAANVREIAQRDLSAICHATGKINVMDSDEFIGIPCLVKLSVKVDPTGSYEPKNEVKEVSPTGGAPASAPRHVAPVTPSHPAVAQANAARVPAFMQNRR